VPANVTTPPQANTSTAGVTASPCTCSGAMNAAVPSRVRSRVSAGPGVERPGDSEIDDLWAETRQQDVRRLQIPVHDSRAVNGGERDGHTDRDAFQARRRHRPVGGDDVFESRPVDVFGDQVRHRRVRVGVENFGGAEPRHPPGVRRLTTEPGAEFVPPAQLGANDLDCHVRAGRGLSEVHGAHAALAEPPEQHIPAQRRRNRQGRAAQPAWTVRPRLGPRAVPAAVLACEPARSGCTPHAFARCQQVTAHIARPATVTISRVRSGMAGAYR